MPQWAELQIVRRLKIFQQLRFLLDAVLNPPVYRLGALHRLLALRTLVRPAPHALLGFRRVEADFRALRLVRPLRLFARGGFKAAYLLLESVIFRQLVSVPPLLILKPRGKVALGHFYIRAVYRENVVNAAVEKRPVVRDEDEAALAPQIPRDALASRLVEMVRRLVDQQKVVLVSEHRRKLELRPLAA